MLYRVAGLLLALQVFVGTPTLPQFAAQGQPSTKNGEWPHYNGDLKGTRYSPLDQINAANFGKLQVAWRFKTDAFGPFPEYKLEGTPLMVHGVLYATAGTRRSVIALDAQTGELIWSHSVREGKRAGVAPRQLSGRGLSYWTDGRAGRVLRQGRARRPESGCRPRRRPADRSRDRRDWRPFDARDRRRRRDC